MLYLQKGNFQKVVRWLAGSWMSANQATFFGVCFVVLAAVGFYVGLTGENCRWFLLLVPIFLVLRMAMNALDGMLAREYNTGSVAGELCNEGLDIVGDTICYGICFLFQIPHIFHSHSFCFWHGWPNMQVCWGRACRAVFADTKRFWEGNRTGLSGWVG